MRSRRILNNVKLYPCSLIAHLFQTSFVVKVKSWILEQIHCGNVFTQRGPPSSQFKYNQTYPPDLIPWSVSPLTMDYNIYKAYISFYRGLFFTWAYQAPIHLFRCSKSVSPSLLLMLSAICSRLAGCYLISSLQIVQFFTSDALLFVLFVRLLWALHQYHNNSKQKQKNIFKVPPSSKSSHSEYYRL